MSRFDRILWRVNGIILFLAGLLALAMLMWALLANFVETPPAGKVAAVVTQQEGSTEKESLNFGEAILVTGTPVIQLPLLGDTSLGRGSFSLKGGGDAFGARNFLFVDYQALSSWWLFEGFQRLVVERHVMRAELGRNETPAIGSIYETVISDTNKDGRVTKNDAIAAYFASPDGKQVQEIVPPTDRIISVTQISNTELLITYQRGQAIISGVFATSSGAKLREATTKGSP